jgi:hypothetical protein
MRVTTVLITVCAAAAAALCAAAPDQQQDKKEIRLINNDKDLLMPDGKIYRDVELMEVNPAGVEVRHAGGIKFLSFKDLPEEAKKEFGYDPEKEKEYLSRTKRSEEKSGDAAQKSAAPDPAAIQNYITKLETLIKVSEERIKTNSEESARLDKDCQDKVEKIISLGGDRPGLDKNSKGKWVFSGKSSSISDSAKRSAALALQAEAEKLYAKKTALDSELDQDKANVKKYRSLLLMSQAKMNALKNPASPGAQAPKSAAEERLLKVKELYDKGLISKDDFERKKAEILSGL